MSGVRVSPPVQVLRGLASIIDEEKMINYIKESVEELKNQVSWPSRQESSSLMVTVAVFSILFALLTWGVDSVFSRLIQIYFSLIK